MSIIILIPAIFAAYVALTQSVHKAFIYVYVPVLLFLPNYYKWAVPAFPDPTFSTAAILVIIGIWFFKGQPGWRLSFTDTVIFAYVCAVLYSESLSLGGKPHYLNFILNFTASTLFPYILAKSLIEPAKLRIEFAKSVVLTLFFVAGTLVIQFIIVSKYPIIQYVLGRFFGGQGWGGVYLSEMRWGLIRANGPFQHEILAGIIMWFGVAIQRWLQWSQAWSNRIPYLPALPITLGQLITLGVFIGAVVTLTRGPILGAILAAFIPLMGLSKQRWVIFWLLVTFAIVVGIPVISWFIEYASVDPNSVESKAHQTVSYRWLLLVNYIDIGKEQLYWGWGRFDVPSVGKHQTSIDNHFLLLFLRHGIIALGLFAFIFISMIIRLFIFSMRQPFPTLRGSTLGFTLLSLYVLYFIALATVWMGHQTIPLFFLLVGWSEGYLYTKPDQTIHAPYPQQATAAASPAFRFKRTLG